MAKIFDPCRRLVGCGPPLYDPNCGYFSIRFWHHGIMTVDSYIAGLCDMFDWCHHDNVGFKLLHKWCVRFGIKNKVRYFWKGGLDGWDGVNQLEEDIELCHMVAKGIMQKTIDIYVKNLDDNWAAEYKDFGYHLEKVCSTQEWDALINSVDGSPTLYKRRAFTKSVDPPRPHCSKRLFGNDPEYDNYSQEYDGLLKDHVSKEIMAAKKAKKGSCQIGEEISFAFKNKNSAAEDDEDFIDEDYNLEIEDEDFLGVISTRVSKGRPRNNDSSLDFQSRIEISKDDYGGDSEYEDDDELNSGDETDDELTHLRRKCRDLEFNVEKNRYNPTLEVGMRFRNFTEFKMAVQNWGIKNRWQLHFPTNDTKRCIAKCYSKKLEAKKKKNKKIPSNQQATTTSEANYEENDGQNKLKRKCTFFIYVAPLRKGDPTVQIKTLQLKHSCGHVFYNFHLTSKWIADRYVDRFRADPTWSEAGLIACIYSEHGYEVSHSKAWRAKHFCLKRIYGEASKQYDKLIGYGLDLIKTNPDTTVDLWRDEGHFMGFYVCLYPLKEAFKKFLRPIICVDGTWLKGLYGGELLAAIGIDPNDCIYPIAWAVVRKENKETWSWFLSHLGEDLEFGSGSHITLMSDRQKGLIGAVKDLFPEAEHRNCVRHIYTNFWQNFKGKELKDLVWNVTRASYPQRFEKWMSELASKDPEAREWFNHCDRPIESWIRAYFCETAKCDILLNNMCECFNNYILDTRGKGIITMLEMIKNRVMKRIYTKKDMAFKWNQQICPKVAKKIEKISLYKDIYICHFSGGPKVKVDGGDSSHVCDLVAHTCTCRRWQLTGLPCTHAIAAINHNRDPIESFVESCYTVQRYNTVYSLYINPTNGEEFWDCSPSHGQVIPPPPKKKKRGRPTTARRKEAEELEVAALKKKITAILSRQQCVEDHDQVHENSAFGATEERVKLSRKGRAQHTCGNCGEKGHNKRKCPKVLVVAGIGNENALINGSTNMAEWFGEECFEGMGVTTQE